MKPIIFIGQPIQEASNILVSKYDAKNVKKGPSTYSIEGIITIRFKDGKVEGFSK